jgi:hypothetical protein
MNFSKNKFNEFSWKEIVQPGTLICCNHGEIMLSCGTINEVKEEDANGWSTYKALLVYQLGCAECIAARFVTGMLIRTEDISCLQVYRVMAEEILKTQPINKNLLSIRYYVENRARLDGFSYGKEYINMGKLVSEDWLKRWIVQAKLGGLLEDLKRG